MPVALFRALDEQTEGLLRDYTLAVLGREEQPFSADDVARAAAAKAGVVKLVEQAAQESWARPPEAVDVTVDLTVIDPGEFGLLQAVLTHANRLARTGELLALPVLPEVAALRSWLCDQVVDQAGGAPPTPWALPDGMLEAPGMPLASWDRMADLPAHEAWIAADDSNQIIGASPAALELLGWTEADLVGQRLVAIIPPRFREAHLASFTLAVLTGRYTLLGRPLELAAHTRDGRDVNVTLTLHHHAAARGRSVFLAHLERRGA